MKRWLLLLALCACSDPLAAQAPMRQTPVLGLNSHQVSDADFERIKSLGITKVRYTLYWRWMEPDGGGVYAKHYLQFWTALIERADRHGIDLLVTVHSPPPAYDHRSDSSYARFIGHMAERFKVEAWQPMNEWDSVCHFGAWFCEGTFEERGYEYGRFLRSVVPRVRQADPDALVVAGAIAEHPTEFLVGLDRADAPYDVLALHVYADAGHLVPVARLKASLSAGRRVWITEFGVRAGDREHGDEWREIVEWAMADAPFERLYGYALRDQDYGLMEGERERPAYHWLKGRAE